MSQGVNETTNFFLEESQWMFQASCRVEKQIKQTATQVAAVLLLGSHELQTWQSSMMIFNENLKTCKKSFILGFYCTNHCARITSENTENSVEKVWTQKIYHFMKKVKN